MDNRKTRIPRTRARTEARRFGMSSRQAPADTGACLCTPVMILSPYQSDISDALCTTRGIPDDFRSRPDCVPWHGSCRSGVEVSPHCKTRGRHSNPQQRVAIRRVAAREDVRWAASAAHLVYSCIRPSLPSGCLPRSSKSLQDKSHVVYTRRFC